MPTIEIEDPVKHERVAKALEQVNGLRYRYHAAVRVPRKSIDDDSEDDEATDDDDPDDERRAKKRDATRAADDDGDDYDDGDQDDERGPVQLSLDDHIERMLRRTRTIALLKIANNTAEVLPDEDFDDDDDDDELYEGEEDGDWLETGQEAEAEADVEDEDEAHVVTDHDDRHLLSSPSASTTSSLRRAESLRRAPSMRKASFRTDGTGTGAGARQDPEAAAAMRLVRTLSSFLSLPKVISYRDLEEITESLLDEPHDHHDEYGDLIDMHIDSARDSSDAGSVGMKRMTPQELSEDPGDLELQQRRVFMENQLRRYSSKNVMSGSSTRNVLRVGSQRSMGGGSVLSGSGSVGSALRLSSLGSMRKESKRSLAREPSWRSGPGSIASLSEEAEGKDGDEDEDDDHGAKGDGGAVGEPEAGVLGTAFDEHEYTRWRTEIKEDYLAWLRAKIEAKKRRRATRKKDADKKPRWLLLYEAAKDRRLDNSEQR